MKTSNKPIKKTAKEQSIFASNNKYETQKEINERTITELYADRQKLFDKMIHEIHGKCVQDKKSIIDEYNDKVFEIDDKIRKIRKQK
jgi:hypothetical protein